jgi:large subunit ribosomal protein L13
LSLFPSYFSVAKDLTLSVIVSTYAHIAMTNFIKKDEIKNNWLLIDAENAIVGRLAAYISKAIRGKDKNQYTPNMDTGDFVVVTNIEKIKFTGKKFNNKKYYRHTGYPGGIKTTDPSKLMKNKPEEILKLAVKRMLPGGPLAKKQLTKLKIYKGTEHPHESQNPKIIEFSKLNKKNCAVIN